MWCVGAGKPSSRPVRDSNSGSTRRLTSPSLAWRASVQLDFYSPPLQPIHLLHKRAVWLIAGAHYLSRTPRLFESLGILTDFDLRKLQLGVLCTIIKDTFCLLY